MCVDTMVNVIVRGDSNSKSDEWGKQTDTQGKVVVEMTARTGLIVFDRGTTTTFRRLGYRKTIVNVILASEGLRAYDRKLEGTGGNCEKPPIHLL